MSTPTIHQRRAAKNRSVGVPLDSASLIRTTPLKAKKHFISPSAPSTAGLHAQWQQPRTRIPGICNDCERDVFADEAHSSRTGGPAFVAFSLSDACPSMGGAHGYVDLLKRVTIPAGDWAHFAAALAAAGLDARRHLSVRDRVLAYVLWNAAMAPPEHRGLGFAPGAEEEGGTLRFLDMRDPSRGVVEVGFFDFLRVLLEKVGLHEEWQREREERRRIRGMVREEMRLRGKKVVRENGSQVDHQGSQGTTETQQTTASLPPLDPPYERTHWCACAGLRKDRFYRVPSRRSVEAVVAREVAIAKGLPIPRDEGKIHYKGKGKGRANAPPNLPNGGCVSIDQPSSSPDAAHLFAPAAAEKNKKPWVVRAGRRIVRVLLRGKKGLPSKVGVEWRRRKVAMGRGLGGYWRARGPQLKS